MILCADDINSWCKSRRLQLNASKTEAIWFGSKLNLAQLNKRDCSIKVCSSIIQTAAVVRDLGLLLDSELSMMQHVTKWPPSACGFICVLWHVSGIAICMMY